MKKSLIKRLSLVLLICMIFSILGTACGDNPDIVEDKIEGFVSEDTSGVVDNGGIEYTYQPPEGEHDIEVADDEKKLTFYWYWEGHEEDLKDCDIWIWYDDVDGRGYTFTNVERPAGDLGSAGVWGKVVIAVPDTVMQVGFIVRKYCNEPGGDSWGTASKDGSSDRFAVLTGKETYIFLKNGDTNQYASDDGVKMVQIKKFNVAAMQDFHTIMYSVTPTKKLTSYDQISLWDGDKKLTILTNDMMGEQSGTGNIRVAEKLEINKQYTLMIEDFGPLPVVPMGIFDTPEFGEMYNYEGNDLGVTLNADGTTTFKVWAPTASKVVLDLYSKGNEYDDENAPIPGSAADAYKHVEMTLGDKGVWSATLTDAGNGTYYTYTVTTAAGTSTATDPYGRAAGLNGNRSMVVDLSTTDPENWSTTLFDPTKSGTVNFDSYSDAFIWEVHVRDFSNMISDTDLNSEYKGKYLAFTQSGLTTEDGIPVGIDYLKELGVTHVHLLPVYDYATVKEENPESGFNWGYDPKNYNVPEGSYSTNPYDGEVRIKEFKQMVQALHDAGIGVIMDVVYNHTASATDSNFHRIVPYYYYRYELDGTNSNGSGCGNETASERYMVGKFIVDSVSYWQSEYNVDGFRFDLMAIHDIDTMQEVEKAVHTANPNAIIYGEGWAAGAIHTIDGTPVANQANISKIERTEGAIGSISVFNDAIRNGLKGDNNETSKGIISGSNNMSDLDKVVFGIMGGTTDAAGWKVDTGMVINYMSAHDNHTLWDKLTLSTGASTAEKARMNRLGAAILFVSKGTPFVQAGEEMLRTKPFYDKEGNLVSGEYDENSYSSCDETNNIKWDKLTKSSEEYKMMQYYAGLAAMRKTYSVFSDDSTRISYEKLGSCGYALYYDGANQDAVVLINASSSSVSYNLTDSWTLVATIDGSNLSVAHNGGWVTVPAGEILVYVK